MEREDMMTETGVKTVRVADHAPAPGGRFVRDGLYSGEWFREEILRPELTRALRDGYTVRVELDGTAGYGSSFLEEAFGGLIREDHFHPGDLDRHLSVVAKTSLFQPFKGLVERYLKEARRTRTAA
jgi:hypothetical protein